MTSNDQQTPITMSRGVTIQSDGGSAIRAYSVIPGVQKSCALAGTRSTGEHTTYLFAAPGAGTRRRGVYGPGAGGRARWWRITATAYPVWHW
jgi:hypothetical protein